MEDGPALLLAAVILAVLVVGAAYAWYNFTGWAAFSYKTGDSPRWAGGDVSRLRFKDCVFTVARGDGKTAALDVSPALNSMAVAYKTGSAVTNPPALTLTRPLNPFSFVIAGFNDRLTVPDPTAAPWCAAPPPPCDCTRGACACKACPGSATATLVGKVRTI
jgi:hypothetical protein